MNWKVKARAHSILDRIPLGAEMYFWLQKNVTKTLPGTSAKYQERLEDSHLHLKNLSRFRRGAGPDLLSYEVGAGWDLLNQFVFYSGGVDRQVVVDIKPLVRRELLNRAIAEVNRYVSSRLVKCRLCNVQIGPDVTGDLKKFYGIEYRAPLDPRATGHPPASFDFITSTNTFEHIPKGDVGRILRECKRLLKPGGLASVSINYQDHFSYTDRSISIYNFLQFSRSEWKKYSPKGHYQNRLRHSDYVELAEQAGFRILLAEPQLPQEKHLKALSALRLDPEFSGRSPEDLGIQYATLVME